MAVHFESRAQAGRALAEKLARYASESPLILAMPRGGVPVAAEIARGLGAELDVLIVKRIGAPDQEELAIGALAESGDPVWNLPNLRALGLDPEMLAPKVREKARDIAHESRLWREGRSPSIPRDRTVLLVDDGLATGSSMRAALEHLRRQRPRKIVVVAPVASERALELVRPLVDEVVVPFVPRELIAVGMWYRDFSPVRDEEVSRLLKPVRAALPEAYDGNVHIHEEATEFQAYLRTPAGARAVVIFAVESEDLPLCAANRTLSETLVGMGMASLFLNAGADEPEERLCGRIAFAARWARRYFRHRNRPLGYFASGACADAALSAAERDRDSFGVVIFAGERLPRPRQARHLTVPTLFLVGGAEASKTAELRSRFSSLLNAEIVRLPDDALPAVAEFTAGWFNQCLQRGSGPPRAARSDQLLNELRKLARPVRHDDDFDALARSLSESRLVFLGEATHGTEEFYEIRRLLTRKLVEDHGFRFMAVEGEWPACAAVHRQLRERSTSGASAAEVLRAFHRWPEWMWACGQIEKLVEWARGRDFGFYGLDVYSLNESIFELRRGAARLSHALRTSIDALAECFEPFVGREAGYVARVIRGEGLCAEAAAGVLRALESERSFEDDELFNLAQNARVVAAAERYYSALSGGGPESWNIRDTHMAECLDAILRRLGEGAKGVVWAHNTHIGDYHATDMLEEGYVNLGGLAREKFGAESVRLVGFGTYRGEVLAGRAWEAPPEIMSVPPAREGSLEAALHRVADELESERLFLDFTREDPAAFAALGGRHGHRAIGVVYDPRSEARGHGYVPTSLPRRYDAFVFADRTSALRPLSGGALERGLLPETWPAGV